MKAGAAGEGALDRAGLRNQHFACAEFVTATWPRIPARGTPAAVLREQGRPMAAAALRMRLWAPVREFAGGDGTATYLRPRWLVLRGVGVIFLFVFAGIIDEGPALVGPGGLSPLGDFFGHITRTFPHPLEAFWRVPSLLWLAPGAGAIRGLAWGGFAAAVALVLNLWPRMALFGCWVALLSFVTTWQIFTSTQVDQLMLETSLLLIPFAPAGYRPGLGADSPPRPLAVFMVRWMLFRVMFESGVIKLVSGDLHWLELSAMDVLYETTPFPTFLAYWDYQMPHAWHVAEALLTYAAEIVAPLLAVWGGRRGRWLALGAWVALQGGIQLTNNFGWLNTAALGLGLLLLDDQMIAGAAARLGLDRWREGPASPPAPGPMTWRWRTLAVALWLHFGLTVVFFAEVVRVPVAGGRWAAALRPLKAVADSWHSANAYTLYANLLPWRFAVEFAGSNDGGRTWRPWEFRHQPQREDRIGGFLAPWYARFEATLQAQANTGEPSDLLFSLVAAHLIARSPEVMALFLNDPFPDAPPGLVRIRGYRLSFTRLATRRETGHYWHREETGDFRPMMYRSDDGRILAAPTPTDELRALAINGDPAAQSQYGLLLASGKEVPKDLAGAIKWCRRAAERGDATGQFFLGLCYLSGEGVSPDGAMAAQWFRRAAEQGLTMAQLDLGMLLLRGDGIPRDEQEALVWFGVAALSGDEDAARYRAVVESRVGPERAAAAALRGKEIRAEIAARKTGK
jgi:TPR repeat protein